VSDGSCPRWMTLSAAAPELNGLASNCRTNSRIQSQTYVTTDGQSVSLSWCQAPSGVQDQNFVTVRQLPVSSCGLPSLTRGRVCRLQLLLSLASEVSACHLYLHFGILQSHLSRDRFLVDTYYLQFYIKRKQFEDVLQEEWHKIQLETALLSKSQI
jgi:hypothetical protein